MRSERTVSSKEGTASKRCVTLMYRKRELCTGKSSLRAGKQQAHSSDPLGTKVCLSQGTDKEQEVEMMMDDDDCCPRGLLPFSLISLT